MENFISKNDNQDGVVTLEILVALALIVICISAVILLVFGSQLTGVGSQTNQEALYLAQKQIEDCRAVAVADLSSLTPSCSAPAGSGYTSNLSITNVNSFTKQISTDITWSGNTHVQLTTQVSDWFAAGGLCNPTLSGDWKNPSVYFSDRLGTYIPGNNSNGLGISDIKVNQGKLYVAAYGATNTDYTFYKFTLPSDPTQAPTFVGGVDNAPTVTPGLNAVAISGNYAYVANGYASAASNCTEGANCAELQVISISGTPSVSRNFKITATTTGSNLPAATSINYYQGYVYLGLAKVGVGSANGEFVVIDVGGGGASPTSPVVKGSYPVGN